MKRWIANHPHTSMFACFVMAGLSFWEADRATTTAGRWYCWACVAVWTAWAFIHYDRTGSEQ